MIGCAMPQAQNLRFVTVLMTTVMVRWTKTSKSTVSTALWNIAELVEFHVSVWLKAQPKCAAIPTCQSLHARLSRVSPAFGRLQACHVNRSQIRCASGALQTGPVRCRVISVSQQTPRAGLIACGAVTLKQPSTLN